MCSGRFRRALGGSRAPSHGTLRQETRFESAVPSPSPLSLSRQGIRPLASTLFSRFSRLGLKRRSDESNLPAYALAVSGTNAYVCVDADTLCHGIQQVTAAKRGADADHRGYLHRCPFVLCDQTRCRRARVSRRWRPAQGAVALTPDRCGPARAPASRHRAAAANPRPLLSPDAADILRDQRLARLFQPGLYGPRPASRRVCAGRRHARPCA